MAGWFDNLSEIQSEIGSHEIKEIVFLYGNYLQGKLMFWFCIIYHFRGREFGKVWPRPSKSISKKFLKDCNEKTYTCEI